MALPVPTDTYPFVTPQLLRLHHGRFDPNIFTRWQRQGKVEKIRNGLYLDTRFEIRGDVDRFLIANQLYAPSYVSLWSAFRYYNFIPEEVFMLTSMSTRKSKEFKFHRTVFQYRSLSPDLFFGYYLIGWKDAYYAIATPEKAILDLAYLEPLFSDVGWLEELRLDEFELNELIDREKLVRYTERYQSKTVRNRIDLFIKTFAL
jgi:predicted transcriptional regulator of viral defense system